MRALDSALRKFFVALKVAYLQVGDRLVEFQAFLAELVSTYEFALTEDAKRIRRELHGVMVPFIEGQTDQEAHLSLKVSFALSGPDQSISGPIEPNYTM